MPILEDDNQDQQQVVVDEQAIANRVIQALQQSQGRPATQEQFDAVKAMTHRLKQENYSDDFIAGQVSAAQALRLEMDQKLNHVANTLVSQISNGYTQDKLQQEASGTIRRALAARYKNTPALKEFDSSIREMIGKKWNSNKQFVSEWNNRQFNENGLEEICDAAADHFEKLIGGGSVDSKTAPTITGSSSATAKNQPTNNNGKEISEDDLENEHQVECFYALESARSRYLGEDTKTARAKALATAHKLTPPPLRKAVI